MKHAANSIITIPFESNESINLNFSSVVSIVGAVGCVYINKMINSENSTNDIVNKLIEYANLKCKTGMRPITIRDKLKRFLNFYSWCELNIRANAIVNIENSKVTLERFFKYLMFKASSGDLNYQTASAQLEIVNEIISFIFDVDFVIKNRKIKGVDIVEATVVPTEYDQARTLKICNLFFLEIHRNIIFGNKFPFLINTPDYLDWPNNEAWIFPTTIWAFNENNGSRQEEVRMRGFSIAYDYKCGRIRSFDELNIMFGKDKTKSMLVASLKNAKKQIDSANLNLQHCQRRRLALQATAAFIVLFVAVTGINWAQLIELTWAENDIYDISSHRQGFRAIKYRANNKEVFFELPLEFIPKFKMYLELRKYLLNGKYFGLLFFNCGVKYGKLDSSKKIESPISKIYAVLDRLDPILNSIGLGVKQWRASMSTHLQIKNDLSMVSKILNNTVETVKKSYSQGSDEIQANEIGEFLLILENVIKEKRDDNEIKSHVGVCTGYGQPVGIDGNTPVCDEMVGCFSCEKYRLIVDEIDTRKILSAKFCLKYQQSQFDINSSQFKEICKVVDRIDILINRMRKVDFNLINAIEVQVEEEQLLDKYWLDKLNMLINLGF